MRVQRRWQTVDTANGSRKDSAGSPIDARAGGGARPTQQRWTREQEETKLGQQGLWRSMGVWNVLSCDMERRRQGLVSIMSTKSPTSNSLRSQALEHPRSCQQLRHEKGLFHVVPPLLSSSAPFLLTILEHGVSSVLVPNNLLPERPDTTLGRTRPAADVSVRTVTERRCQIGRNSLVTPTVQQSTTTVCSSATIDGKCSQFPSQPCFPITM